MGYELLTLLLFPIVSVLFVVLGIPLKLGKVRPNLLYGFRTPKSLSNETIWYEVNRVSGQDMINIGFGLGLLALFVLPFRKWLGADVAIAILTTVLLASVAWMVIHGSSVLRKL